MTNFIFSFIATLLVGVISLTIVIFLVKSISKRESFLTLLISFAAGALIGDVFLHLLPEQIENFGYGVVTPAFIIVGITLMLIVESYFHCSHDSSHELREHHGNTTLARMNTIGTSLHNFLDGIAIATSFLAGPAIGITTTFAVIMHEIPKEMADSGILLYAGWQKRRVIKVNIFTGIAALFGVVIVYLLTTFTDHIQSILVPLAIGQLIYISLSDLVPEIHHDKGIKKYLITSSMFVLGILIMALLKIVG